jgi:hypothetical protein
MRQAILADTGPLYAAADPDDAYHQKLLSFADQPITLFDATVAVLSGHLGFEVWTLT